MGYRSSWRLVINTADSEYKQKFKDWLELQKIILPEPMSGWHEVAQCIWESCEAEVENELIYAEGSTKCSDPWDHFIDEVFDLCCQGSGMDAAYCRLGENYDDHETRDGEVTNIYIDCNIGEHHCGEILKPEVQVSVPIKSKCVCDLNQIMRGEGHDPTCSDKV